MAVAATFLLSPTYDGTGRYTRARLSRSTLTTRSEIASLQHHATASCDPAACWLCAQSFFGHVCTTNLKSETMLPLDAHLVRVGVQLAYRRGTSGLLFGTFATIQLIPNDCVMTCDGLYNSLPATGGSTGVSQIGVVMTSTCSFRR